MGRLFSFFFPFLFNLTLSLDHVVVIDGAVPTVAVHDPAAASCSRSTTANNVVIVNHWVLVWHLLEQSYHHATERCFGWIEHRTLIKAMFVSDNLWLSSRSGLQVVALEAQVHHLIVAGVC